tara:strand:- start:20 stop:166 length:147 start_codon:yes stop_codon:yes gene_type:complete
LILFQIKILSKNKKYLSVTNLLALKNNFDRVVLLRERESNICGKIKLL